MRNQILKEDATRARIAEQCKKGRRGKSLQAGSTTEIGKSVNEGEKSVKGDESEKSIFDTNRRIVRMVCHGDEDPFKTEKITTDFFGNAIEIKKPHGVVSKPMQDHQEGFEFALLGNQKRPRSKLRDFPPSSFDAEKIDFKNLYSLLKQEQEKEVEKKAIPDLANITNKILSKSELNTKDTKDTAHPS